MMVGNIFGIMYTVFACWLYIGMDAREGIMGANVVGAGRYDMMRL